MRDPAETIDHHVRLSLSQLGERLKGHNPGEVVAPGARRAAVAVVVWEGDRDLEMLFMRRAERRDDPWSGQVSFPGGHEDQGDSNPAQTARRETLEEVGLTLPPPIAQLDDVHPRIAILPDIVVRPYVFALPGSPLRPAPAPLRPMLGGEAKQVIQVGFAEMMGSRRISTVNARDRLLTVEGYRIGPHFIWGMTLRILDELFGKLGISPNLKNLQSP